MTWLVPQNVPMIGPEEADASAKTVLRNWITEGKEAQEFSAGLRRLIGAPSVTLAPNGTLALYLALKAAGIVPGDEVVVPDLTFIASATAVLMTGAKPVFVDTDECGLADVTVGLGPRTAALMPVHLFGFVSPYGRGIYSVPVIEDSCQALGSEPPGMFSIPGRRRIQVYSFFADKSLTTGEGGAVATNDEGLLERMTYLRNQGRLDRGSFVHPEIGINLRMTDLQCAVGNAQLAKFDRIRKERQRIHLQYMELFRNSPCARVLSYKTDFVPFRTVVVLVHPVAQSTAQRMRIRGKVEPREMFVPLHRQPCFAHIRDSRYADCNFNGAIRLWQTGLLLPNWPGMTQDDISVVFEEVTLAFKEAS